MEGVDGYLPGEMMNAEDVAALVATLNARIARLEAALPDPDKLLWIVTWLDKADAVLTAYVEHHDQTCSGLEYGTEDCGDLGPGEKRTKLLEFMDHTVQDGLREDARRIKEAQSHG